MATRRRKTLVVCQDCHHHIHYGRYDGPALSHKSHWRADVRWKHSCVVLREAVGKVPNGNSLAAYSTCAAERAAESLTQSEEVRRKYFWAIRLT